MDSWHGHENRKYAIGDALMRPYLDVLDNGRG